MTIYKISLSDAQADWLADYLSSTASGMFDFKAAEEIRAQIPKPEPTEFGSVVRAPWSGLDLLWVKAAHNSWWSESGVATAWSELRNPEVLRVGIGE